MNIFCIDIGGTNIKYCMFCDTVQSEIKSIKTPKGLNTEDMKKAIFSLIDNTYTEFKSIDFISISNCAQMKDNEVVYTSSKPGYIGCNWQDIIKEKYNINCIANNDLHCAVAGEYHNLKDKPKNFIALSIGTGINIATIINGELFTGDENLSCYLDNITDLDGNNQFKCASTAQLLKLYETKSNKIATGEEFIELLKMKEPCAIDCYNIWIYRIAHFIKAVTYMYNINTISICGGILNSEYPIYNDIKNTVELVTAKPYYEKLKLLKSSLNSPQLHGTYALALKEINKNIII